MRIYHILFLLFIFTIAINTTNILAETPYAGVAVPNGKIRDQKQNSKAVLFNFNKNKIKRISQFAPFGKNARSAMFCANGELSGDSIQDIIIGQGNGAKGGIKIFNGSNRKNATGILNSINVFSADYKGGVSVATGDVNGDDQIDIIAGASSGAPRVVIFNVKDGSVINSFFAYESTFRGGVRVATGDINGDGVAEIITGTGSAGSHVKIFNGSDGTLINSFFAYNSTFKGGVYVAAGDINNDGKDDIIVGPGKGKGGGPVVKVFDGGTLTQDREFFAYNQNFNGGVTVAVGSDINQDGYPEIITGSASGRNGLVKIFSVSTTNNLELGRFAPFNKDYNGGIFVCANYTSQNSSVNPEPTNTPSATPTISTPDSFIDVLSDANLQNFQLNRLTTGCGLNISISGTIAGDNLIFNGLPGNGPITFFKDSILVWKANGVTIFNIPNHTGTATADGCNMRFNFSNNSGGTCQALFQFNPNGTIVEDILNNSLFSNCP